MRRKTLDASLQAVHRTANAMQSSGSDTGIPETLIHYVENGRNPDIYTREFVELVRRMNQLTRGKLHAFASFRDVLAHEMENALPELRDDVRRVVHATGGQHNIESQQGQQQGQGLGLGQQEQGQMQISQGEGTDQRT